MTNFIKNPNLPKNSVNTIITGKIQQNLVSEFSNLNVNTIMLNNSQKLQDPVKNHVDLLCHHLENKKLLITNDNINKIKYLNDIGFDVNVINNSLECDYPKDVYLNAARIDNNLICNKKFIAQEILEYCENNNINIIDVKQGYSKCSICIVDNNAIITEDESIYKQCKLNDIDCLLIKKGFVKLQGYEYGFIGGCCAKISKTELAFFGDIKLHPDYNNIKTFLLNYGVYDISLSNSYLIDIGGAIPILENN